MPPEPVWNGPFTTNCPLKKPTRSGVGREAGGAECPPGRVAFGPGRPGPGPLTRQPAHLGLRRPVQPAFVVRTTAQLNAILEDPVVFLRLNVLCIARHLCHRFPCVPKGDEAIGCRGGTLGKKSGVGLRKQGLAVPPPMRGERGTHRS